MWVTSHVIRGKDEQVYKRRKSLDVILENQPQTLHA